MTFMWIAAREQGKYEAIGGHRARPGLKTDPVTGRTLCSVCRRPLTWNEERHAGGRRAKPKPEPTRCRGRTKSGSQCLRSTTRNPSFCWEHR